MNDGIFSIPLPPWVLEEINKNPDLVYTDRSGRRNPEYISLGCDSLPVLRGRTPLQVYSDYMRSFRDRFRDYLGSVIVVSTTPPSSATILGFLSQCTSLSQLNEILNSKTKHFCRKFKWGWVLVGSSDIHLIQKAMELGGSRE